MQQECQTHERHDDAFLDEFVLERLDCAINQFRAVVVHGDFHVVRQSLHRCRQPGFHILDYLVSVRTIAHDDDTADGFAFAIRLGNAAPHVRAKLDGCHVAQQNRHALIADAYSDLFQIVEAGDVAFDA